VTQGSGQAGNEPALQVSGRDFIISETNIREGEMKRMADRAVVAQKILEELSQDDNKVRDRFLGEFRQEALEFAQHMADALLCWLTLIGEIAPDKRVNENIAAFSPNTSSIFRKCTGTFSGLSSGHRTVWPQLLASRTSAGSPAG